MRLAACSARPRRAVTLSTSARISRGESLRRNRALNVIASVTVKFFVNDVVLRNVTDADLAQTIAIGQRHTADAHVAGIRRPNSAERVEQSRLALARSAEHTDEFPGRYIERNVVQNRVIAHGDRNIARRNGAGRFRFDARNRVTEKFKHVAGDAEAIAEDKPLAHERFAIQFRPGAAGVADEIFAAIAFDDDV